MSANSEALRLKAYLDRVGFPTAPHPQSEAVIAGIEGRLARPLDELSREFLQRSLHGLELWTDAERAGSAACLHTYSPELLEEWSGEESTLPKLEFASVVCFASDQGSSVFVLDLDDRWGFGQGAVYSVERGAPSVDFMVLVARNVVDLLAIHADEGVPIERSLIELRDEQTSDLSLPLVTANGRQLPADLVFEPRYHPGLDALRSVRLGGPLILDGVPFGPLTGYRNPGQADLRFARDGHVQSGFLANAAIVQGVPLAAGSLVTFQDGGSLWDFTLAEDALVNGILCRGGSEVLLYREDTFHFVPVTDIIFEGYPCRAAEKVEAGPAPSLGFTAARPFPFAGRLVPTGARVARIYNGELRFTISETFELEGQILPPGTHVWYGLDGTIKEVYPKP